MTSTYIVQDNTIGVTPMSRVPTKVKFLIQYTKRDNTKINLFFIIPMTSFIEEDDDNGFKWKYSSSTVLKSYMEKSILYLTNNTNDDRAEIRKAKYTITGIQPLPDGSKKRTSLDHTYEDYIEDFFREYMDLMGDYSLCEYIDIFAKLSHHKIESCTNLEKPDDLSKAEEEIIFSIATSPTHSINNAPVPSPPHNTTANITTVHHHHSNVVTPPDQHISNVPVVTINDDDDARRTNNVLDASAPTFTPNLSSTWRN